METTPEQQDELKRLVDATVGDDEWEIETAPKKINGLPPRSSNGRPLYSYKKPAQPLVTTTATQTTAHAPIIPPIDDESDREKEVVTDPFANRDGICTGVKLAHRTLPMLDRYIAAQLRNDQLRDMVKQCNQLDIETTTTTRPTLRLTDDDQTTTSCSTTSLAMPGLAGAGENEYGGVDPVVFKQNPEYVDDDLQIAIEASLRDSASRGRGKNNTNDAVTTLNIAAEEVYDPDQDQTLTVAEREEMRRIMKESLHDNGDDDAPRELKEFRSEMIREIEQKKTSRAEKREFINHSNISHYM
jgi:hypothetical protein